MMVFLAQEYATHVSDRRFPERVCYEVDPAVAYPAVIADIVEVLHGKGHSSVLNALVQQARQLPDLAWEYALEPKVDFATWASPQQIAQRAQALDIVRKWMTQLLHAGLNGVPMYVHIVKRFGWEE